jgi:hypothetical protein
MLRSRITGLMTCATAVIAVLCLRLGRGIFQGMLERGNDLHPALSRITVVALTITSPTFLLVLLVIGVTVVVVTEAKAKSEASRLLAQAAILQVFVLLLAIAMSGFLLHFHIPDVTIR